MKSFNAHYNISSITYVDAMLIGNSANFKLDWLIVIFVAPDLIYFASI